MRSRILLGSVFVLSVAAAACSGQTAQQDGAATSQTAAAATKAPVATQVKAPHLRLVADALSDVALRDDQRAEIEQMAKDAEARHAAGAQAHVDLANALAAQIEAGQIDRAALQPKIDAMVAAMEASRPADRAAFERLHALLTPEQRSQFVDAMESRMKAKHAEHPAREHMQEWATALNLTDAQKEQIHATLKESFKAHHDGAAMHERMHHGHDRLEAFRADTFAAQAPSADVKQHAGEMADHFLGLVEKVLPVLTPDQRKIAADKIRAKAATGELGHFE
jgi:Spy/CpxP family protein refolding chaperone